MTCCFVTAVYFNSSYSTVKSHERFALAVAELESEMTSREVCTWEASIIKKLHILPLPVIIPVIPVQRQCHVMSLVVGIQGQKAYGLCKTPLCAELVVQFSP